MVGRISGLSPLPPDSHRNGEMQFQDAGPQSWRLVTRTPAWRPPTDVYENEAAIVVRVEVAGLREDDFSIELDGRYLTIRGARMDTPERRAYHQMEIRFGEFSTEIELLVPVVASQAEAVYNNGFLRVMLPKASDQPGADQG